MTRPDWRDVAIVIACSVFAAGSAMYGIHHWIIGRL